MTKIIIFVLFCCLCSKNWPTSCLSCRHDHVPEFCSHRWRRRQVVRKTERRRRRKHGHPARAQGRHFPDGFPIRDWLQKSWQRRWHRNSRISVGKRKEHFRLLGVEETRWWTIIASQSKTTSCFITVKASPIPLNDSSSQKIEIIRFSLVHHLEKVSKKTESNPSSPFY